MTEIHSTKNYKQFKLSQLNREVNPKHVQKLKNSIENHDMLENNPIMVNADMIVLDGQHRLKAAEELDKCIYYTIVKEAEDLDMTYLNENHLRWTTNDWLQFWAAQGKESYIWVLEMQNKYDIALSALQAIIKADHRTFISGRFNLSIHEMTNIEKIFSKVKEFLFRFNDCCPAVSKYDWIHSRIAVKTLGLLFSHPDITVEKLLTKVQTHLYSLERKATLKQYIKMFLDIWNYNRRSNRLEVGEFTSR